MKEYYATARKTAKRLQVDVHSHGQHYTIDEPKNGGGSNTGMNPVELELSTLGASLQATAAKLAPQKNFHYDKLTINLEGDLDPRGFMGNAKIRNGFQEIRVTMTFKTNASQKDCAAFAEEVKKQTPILDNLANGIEITVDNVILD
jgi:uncharacterized OsmC-like protein